MRLPTYVKANLICLHVSVDHEDSNTFIVLQLILIVKDTEISKGQASLLLNTNLVALDVPIE